MKIAFRMVASIVAVMLVFPLIHVLAAEDDDETEPQRSCPFASGTLAQGLDTRVVRTTRVGLIEYNSIHTQSLPVEISLEHVLSAAWTCATWEVELLLPPAMSLHSRSTSTTLTALTRTDKAQFNVRFDRHASNAHPATADDFQQRADLHQYRGWLAVQVFNGEDTPVSTGDGSDAQGRYHYPVEFVLHKN